MVEGEDAEPSPCYIAAVMQPRQHVYTFAHRVLAQDAHDEPSLWRIITGDKAYGYLQTRWADAGAGAEPMTGMLWVEPIRVAGLEISLLRMPEPQAPTEPYFAAFVRAVRGGPLRYFVLERSSTSGAFWSEWRAGGMRIRGADVPEYPSDLDARARLPYPYAAAFVDAIVAEAGDASAAGASTSGASDRKKLLVAIGVAVAVLAVVLAVVMRNGDTKASAPRRDPIASPPLQDDSVKPPPVTAPETAPSPIAEPSATPDASPPADRPTTRKQAPSSKANVDPAVIKRVMAKRSSKLQFCYEKALAAKPALAGTITVTFTIDSAGKPTAISTSGLPEVSACITTVIEQTAFPNSSGRSQQVVYPLKFVPS